MDCRNKTTAKVTRTSFTLLTAFNCLTEDHQLQVLMVPLLHWRQFSCRSAGGVACCCQRNRSTLLPATPVYLKYSFLSQRERIEGQINSSTSSCYHLLPATIFFQREHELRSLLGFWPFIQPSACTLNGEPEGRRQISDQRKGQGGAWELLK